MTDAHLLHDLLAVAAARDAAAPALSAGPEALSYGELQHLVLRIASSLLGMGLARGDRVGIWLEKRVETVAASFGAPAAGGVMVPMNPLLKPEQVLYIARDCNVRVLVTSPDRLLLLGPLLHELPDLRHVVVTAGAKPTLAMPPGIALHAWADLLQAPPVTGHRVIDTDTCAILYTSGSTGRPKGVVLSHRNMVAGAKSVASYLGNHAGDTLLAALPLSFDAGFSQLTTAFHVGAKVVLLNYLMPRDVLKAMVKHRVTGLTAVPPLYIQLTQLDWPAEINQHLRYFANTGGRMPRETLNALRARAPSAQPFLMYGLTEAFRSTYLPPEEVDRRPDSIGKAIPNAEILVLREDGTECGPDEPGELVHRGALVGQGYWNDADKTAERYKLLPAGVGEVAQLLVDAGGPLAGLGELNVERRHGREAGHPVLDHGLEHVARQQVVQQHHLGADVKGCGELAEAGVKAERQRRQQGIGMEVVEVAGHALRASDHVAVAEHHALGLAGGSAGVEDGADVSVDDAVDGAWRSAQGLRPLMQLHACRKAESPQFESRDNHEVPKIRALRQHRRKQ